jgi:hypothetical protein
MLGSDKVATAAYIGKLFKDYDELKMAFLQGHDWLSTLAAEYHFPSAPNASQKCCA